MKTNDVRHVVSTVSCLLAVLALVLAAPLAHALADMSVDGSSLQPGPFAAHAPTPQRFWSPGEAIAIEIWPPLRSGHLSVATIVSGFVPTPPARCIEAPHGVWLAHEIHFFLAPDGWRALLPVPLRQETGPVLLTLRCGPLATHVTLPVIVPPFDVDQLTVAPKFTAERNPGLRARIARERAAMSAALSSADPKRWWRGSFMPPVDGRITATFGTARTFNGTLSSRHEGIDINGRPGDPVYASNDGLVTLVAQRFFFSGNAVVIAHGMGLVSMYFHLSEQAVSTGQQVHKGQLIGRVGMTGRVTGPHLHFGVKLDDISVDPVDLLTYPFDEVAMASP
jgi:hypothetical protein